MTKGQKQVLEFHRKHGVDYPERPKLPDGETWRLRMDLILEEFMETDEAFYSSGLEKVADGLGDLLYVVHGAALACGIDLEPIFDEIHRSNMTKEPGKHREDGKILKTKAYEPPNLGPILQNQVENGWKED